MNPQFSSRLEEALLHPDGRGHGRRAERPISQLFCVPLEKIDKDPEEVAEPPRPTPAPARPRKDGRRPVARWPGRGLGPAKEPKIDWAGLKRRTRQVTRMPSGVRNYIPASRRQVLIYVASEGAAAGAGAVADERRGRWRRRHAVDLHDRR